MTFADEPPFSPGETWKSCGRTVMKWQSLFWRSSGKDLRYSQQFASQTKESDLSSGVHLTHLCLISLFCCSNAKG